MHNLRIEYVQRLPRAGEDLPPDVVELWIGVSGRKVVVNIVRRGFILAAPVMRIIRGRIKRLALATSDTSRPLPERIGISPDLSPDWRQFLDELVQKDDSWSFLVNYTGTERPSNQRKSDMLRSSQLRPLRAPKCTPRIVPSAAVSMERVTAGLPKH